MTPELAAAPDCPESFDCGRCGSVFTDTADPDFFEAEVARHQDGNCHTFGGVA